MNHPQKKADSIQEALSNLTLQPRKQQENQTTDRILIGKILTTRLFRRFTISEIIQKTWRLQERVQIDKISENVFKFCFGNKRDKEFVFRSRPWSLNGSHLVLKEWPEEMILSEIALDTTTFHIQVHGLPPMFLHEGSAESIGKKIGTIHMESINQKCVIGQRYLRIRVDVAVEEPLPAGFFQKREAGEDYWVQFKYERLSDFCYKCGLLSHVTGRCRYGEPATVTSSSGIVAKQYGPWIRSEHPGSLLFINPPVEGSTTPPMITETEEGKIADLEKDCLIGKLNEAFTEKAVSENLQNEDITEIFLNEVAKSSELETLILTLKRHEWGNFGEVQQSVIDFMRQGGGGEDITHWAKKMIQGMVLSNLAERKEVGQNGPLSLGMGPSYKEGASGEASIKRKEKLSARKRMAQTELVGSSRSNVVLEEIEEDTDGGPRKEKDDIIEEAGENLGSLNITTPKFQTGCGGAGRQAGRSRVSRSWKKDARKKSMLTEDNNGGMNNNVRRNLDFLEAEEAGLPMPPPLQ